MNHRYIPIIIVTLFTAMASITSYGSYCECEQRCQTDLCMALEKTLSVKESEEITPDTIKTFRQFLTIDELRANSFVMFSNATDGNNSVLKTKSLKWQKGLREQMYSGYSLCSFADVWQMSDQRLPSALMLFGIIASAMAAMVVRKKQNILDNLVFVGNMAYNKTDGMFYDSQSQRIDFTPMQQQLMDLLFNAANHEATQQNICQALWQSKDNAAESLYTLIRRLRKVLNQKTNLEIELERGKGYRLTEKQI
jgi:DNA-binding winged helix-turn-helix (wHTH) protein